MNRLNLDYATLDRPIWAALTTTQMQLGFGNQLARRYYPEVAPFAALATESPECFAALGELLSPAEQVLLKTFKPFGAIDGLNVKDIGMLNQMVLSRRNAKMAADPGIVNLSEDDADEMHELVVRTKPGPFGERTMEMGHYIGIRDDGRLIAMAGERMRFDGFVEISAVCVDSNYRGKGLARRLVVALGAQIESRGETAFLHVLADNLGAIKLYKDIGFDIRQAFFLSAISPVSTIV